MRQRASRPVMWWRGLKRSMGMDGLHDQHAERILSGHLFELAEPRMRKNFCTAP
ncbi:hypothetical protein VFPPC_15623 [Pochonia chlamydosporia 170]|uniref:Uncharacterized protein n=1 Tax=Pochonia chlamydosporia 170 TaxID=1380566 RepID=A0A179G056_METCM|nr:hypothetical protein VFPPC_15623 [Pochonia chlamydosporia 170]OAQ70810.2 hypothetical protein VFPPC_15623 [Pochonia chlamydosporia 170]